MSALFAELAENLTAGTVSFAVRVQYGARGCVSLTEVAAQASAERNHNERGEKDTC